MHDFSSLDFFTLVGSLAGGAVFVGIVYYFVYRLLLPQEGANAQQQDEIRAFQNRFPGGKTALGFLLAALSLITGYAISNTTVRFFEPAHGLDTSKQPVRLLEDEEWRKWVFETPDNTIFRELLDKSATLRQEVAYSRPPTINLYHLAGRARMFGTMMVNSVAACFALLWLLPVAQGDKQHRNVIVRRFAFGVLLAFWIVVYYFPNLCGLVYTRYAFVIMIPAILIGVVWWIGDHGFHFRTNVVGAIVCVLAAIFFEYEAIQQWKGSARVREARLLFERDDSGRIVPTRAK